MVCLRGAEAQAAPRLGDDDAVGRIVRRVANLDGEVGADVVDVVGQGGDVLGALVGDAADAVVVDDDVGRWGGTFGLGGGLGGAGGGAARLHDHGVHDGAVGDASGTGEQVAAFALDLFGGGLAPRQDIAGDADRSDYANANRGEDSGRAEGERHMNWNQREHRPLPKSIAYRRWFGGERYCLSNERMGDCGGRERLLQPLRAADLMGREDAAVEGV